MLSHKASLGAVALVLCGTPSLCAAATPDQAATASAKAARKAVKALDRHRDADAVQAAEQAVTLAPQDAGYRMILGRSYLRVGRFASAEQAFADTLQLDRGNGRAALNLALMQVARGDRPAAQATLAANAAAIGDGDRGLAMALAGDATGAVALLTQVARSPASSPQLRQNLALAYALAGRWDVARVVAAADMSPADVDARLQEWAAFAQAPGAADQVAALLGVRPVADGGQPVALALNPPLSVPAPVAPEPVAVAVAAPIEAVPVAPPRITFAAPREVVQVLVSRTAPVKTARAAPKPRAGRWYVQLGAFDTAAEAREAWTRATRRLPVLAGQTPRGSTFRAGKVNYYRLAVGGISRAAAKRTCRDYRAEGGDCFIRTVAGDDLVAWLRSPDDRLATR